MKISVRERASDGRCPLCGAPMVERVSRRGDGLPFLGCSRFPECTHTVDDSLGGDPDHGEQRAYEARCRLAGRRPDFIGDPDQLLHTLRVGRGAERMRDGEDLWDFPEHDDWGW